MAVTEAHLEFLNVGFQKQKHSPIARGKMRMVKDILSHPTPMTKGQIEKTLWKYKKVFRDTNNQVIAGRVLLLEYVLQQMRGSNKLLRCGK